MFQQDKLIDPVFQVPDEKAKVIQKGIALCLSGGGYRAMLFHGGALWRLNEAGVLKHVKRISSVSGGSITAAALGLAWKNLLFIEDVASNFCSAVVEPIRKMADRSIDARSILTGLLPAVTVSGQIAAAYDRVLFHGATLQDLPDDAQGPRFVINATNVQTCVLWRFSKPYMGDYRVGRWLKPRVRLADAVAASSAFPPVLSPSFLEPDGPPDEAYELGKPPFTTNVELTDGGVYDNLGLETAFKRCSVVLVSDAGRPIATEQNPADDWLNHAYRIIEIFQSQILALRKRSLIEAYQRNERGGAYWGLASELKHFGVEDRFGFFEKDSPWSPYASRVKSFETRLRAVEPAMQMALINWGYLSCDAALQAHAAKDLLELGVSVKAAGELPYGDEVLAR